MTSDELRQYRKALGLSQRKIADALGVGKNTVSRWECGTRRIQHPRMLALALERLAQMPLTSHTQSR